MIKLKNYRIPYKTTQKHKIVWKTLWVLTFIIFLPFALLQLLNDGLEIILNAFGKIRENLVHSIFKLLYLKECNYYEEEEEE